MNECVLSFISYQRRRQTYWQSYTVTLQRESRAGSSSTAMSPGGRLPTTLKSKSKAAVNFSGCDDDPLQIKEEEQRCSTGIVKPFSLRWSMTCRGCERRQCTMPESRSNLQKVLRKTIFFTSNYTVNKYCAFQIKG